MTDIAFSDALELTKTLYVGVDLSYIDFSQMLVNFITFIFKN